MVMLAMTAMLANPAKRAQKRAETARRNTEQTDRPRKRKRKYGMKLPGVHRKMPKINRITVRKTVTSCPRPARNQEI